jgi:hypothetical protein
MKAMDHSEAVRLQAAEKYVLGELQGPLRDEYEEHYFDCAECAADLKATAAFVSMSRMAFREEPSAAATAVERPTSPQPSWVQPFRWAFVAVPAFAALALAVIAGYQREVTIPNLQKSVALAPSSASAQVLELGASAVRRGGDAAANETPFVINPSAEFSVNFDFTPSGEPALAYVCQLKDSSGRIVLQQAVPGAKANQAFSFAVPGGLLASPGKYQVVFLPADAATGQPSSAGSVMSFPITIAFRQ